MLFLLKREEKKYNYLSVVRFSNLKEKTGVRGQIWMEKYNFLCVIHFFIL
jgi:hypothetical protein